MANEIIDKISADLKVHTGHEMTASDFALLIEKMFPGRSGILSGCTLSITTNTINISAGWLVIRGRIVKVLDSSIPVTLPTSQIKKYIYAAVRLSDTDDPATIEVADKVNSDTATFNQSGTGSAYLTIGSVTAAPTGLTNLETVSTVIPDQPTIRIGTAAPTSSTPGKDGDIYIQYSK